jgi:hypothetical protein
MDEVDFKAHSYRRTGKDFSSAGSIKAKFEVYSWYIIISDKNTS